MDLYFVRHGESEANLKGVFAGGGEDSPLTPKGREQARQAAEDLLQVKVASIVCSPLLRAHETARIIASTLGIDESHITVDPRIAEYEVGELSGKPLRSVSSRQLISTEGAEDPQAFQQRVLACLRDCCRASQKRSGVTLVVSHAGVARTIEAARTSVDSGEFYDLPALPNASALLLNLDWL